LRGDSSDTPSPSRGRIKVGEQSVCILHLITGEEKYLDELRK
jgi:hypothetical protein